MSIFDELDQDPVTLPQIAAVTGVDAALIEGGLAVIPSALLGHVEFVSLALFASFGQRTVDTVLRANESAGSHVLVDRYYQQMWPASWSDSVGLYGASGIDLGTPDVDLPATTIRVRHRRLPGYVVRTQGDLDKIALWWQSRIDDPGKVLYRGQNRLYGLLAYAGRSAAAIRRRVGDHSRAQPTYQRSTRRTRWRPPPRAPSVRATRLDFRRAPDSRAGPGHRDGTIEQAYDQPRVHRCCTRQRLLVETARCGSASA